MITEKLATILTIEDTVDVRRSFVAYLEDCGYRVLQAGDGKEGLRLFEEAHPDLVLVDLRLPELDGLDVLDRIQQISPVTPTIVVSGTGLIDNAVKALHLGAWDYLMKPIHDLSMLRHAVESSLQKARLIKENKRYQQCLEEEIAARTAQLEDANRALMEEIEVRRHYEEEREKLIGELRTRNAELEQFTHTVSHELKSPLITIKGFVGAIQQDLEEGDTAHTQSDVTRIAEAANVMLQLLDDLLDLSRIGRTVKSSDQVSITELINEAQLQLADSIAERGVTIEVSPDLPEVYGDRARLFEVFSNLLDNAVRYMGDQSDPRIEIDTRRTNGETIFYVKDNGTGIEAEYHKTVFGLFDRLNQNQRGTGVGLARAKRIVEVHGGRIWVESAGKNQGATFYLTLPLSPSPTTGKKSPLF